MFYRCKAAHLSAPPPFTGVEIMVEPSSTCFVEVMLFGCKDENRRKLGITVEDFCTLNHVTEIDVVVHVIDCNHAPMECRATWKLIIDDLVKLLIAFVRQTKQLVYLVMCVTYQ